MAELGLGARSTIQTGKAADLVVFDGDPLQDLTALERPWLVIAGGKVIRHPDRVPQPALSGGRLGASTGPRSLSAIG